jgi:hypothetical protein
MFNSIYFLHVYRERDVDIDGLSKVGLRHLAIIGAKG